MEKTFKKEIQSLDEIFDFLNEFITVNGIDDSFVFSIDFIVEELFTNMVKYNTASLNDILINLSKVENNLIIKIIDFDAEPFDLTKIEEQDVSLPLQDRKVGGLGIFLVKKTADKIDYEYKNRQNRITITKNLEK